MKVQKAGRVNSPKSKGNNFFVPKKSATKQPNDSSSDNFFVQKKDAGKKESSQQKMVAPTKNQDNFKRKLGKKGKSNKDENQKKSTFDKKKWRLQKYSNKYKVEQWQEKRKQAVLKDYRRQVDGDAPKLDVHKIYEEYADDIAAQPEDGETSRVQEMPSANSDKVEETIKIENENNTNSRRFTRNSKPGAYQGKQKKMLFKKERLAFEKTKKDREVKREEFLRKQKEREEALKRYKEKKLIKSKKLNQKTKRGQPIMKGRIEMLLEQIQSSKASDS